MHTPHTLMEMSDDWFPFGIYSPAWFQGAIVLLLQAFLARQNCCAYSACIATATPASPSAPFESKSISLAVCNTEESS